MTIRLRILSANLWNGKADGPGVARLVAEEGVDVACFQEVSHRQAEALREVLPHGRIEPAEDHCGMGIAMRQPGKVAWLPLPYRSMRAARLEPKDWPGLSDPIHVWNLHMRAPTQWPPLRTVRIRQGQLRGLLAHLERPVAPRLVLLGDFNASPVWPVYRRVAERLPDLAQLSAERRGRKPASTWAPWTGARRPRLFRIDHAFGRGVTVQDVRTVHLPGSDHAGLIVDLGVD